MAAPAAVLSATFISRLRERRDHTLSGADQQRCLGRRQYSGAEQVVYLTDEGIEVPNRAIILSRVHQLYGVLQMPRQRVVLAPVYYSLGEERIHGVDDGLGLLLRRHNREADGVRRPAAGLLTVTLKLPAVAISEAGMAAVSCVALTNVVARALPLKLTVEPLTKFVRFTVKMKAGPPAIALVGEMLVIVGAGKQDLGGNTATDSTEDPETPVVRFPST